MVISRILMPQTVCSIIHYFYSNLILPLAIQKNVPKRNMNLCPFNTRPTDCLNCLKFTVNERVWKRGIVHVCMSNWKRCKLRTCRISFLNKIRRNTYPFSTWTRISESVLPMTPFLDLNISSKRGVWRSKDWKKSCSRSLLATLVNSAKTFKGKTEQKNNILYNG